VVRPFAVRVQEVCNPPGPSNVADSNRCFYGVRVDAELPGLAEADAVEHFQRRAQVRIRGFEVP
jgi:hypothetical protein